MARGRIDLGNATAVYLNKQFHLAATKNIDEERNKSVRLALFLKSGVHERETELFTGLKFCPRLSISFCTYHAVTDNRYGVR